MQIVLLLFALLLSCSSDNDNFVYPSVLKDENAPCWINKKYIITYPDNIDLEAVGVQYKNGVAIKSKTFLKIKNDEVYFTKNNEGWDCRKIKNDEIIFSYKSEEWYNTSDYGRLYKVTTKDSVQIEFAIQYKSGLTYLIWDTTILFYIREAE